MTQFSNGHKVPSGLLYLMKLYSRQLKHVFSKLIYFQQNLKSNVEIPDAFNKGI